ncbi:MAG: acyl-CoA dehydratase activase-related protein [Bacillota bacterium]|nr:acyl-CoA dehydratase activase-related protein [Bacillota bacterium]
MQKPKVGIPRALSYYTFYPLWRVFLEKLGTEVVLSSPTNRQILEDGIRETVNDACIPIKVFHGHVLDLIRKVDYLFIPRMISADSIATFCPKFLGLPDMIRFTGVNLPQIIDIRFNLKGLPGGLWRFFRAVAREIGINNPFKILYAQLSALKKQRYYQKLLSKGLTPPEALELVFDRDSQIEKTPKGISPLFNAGGKIVIGLLGYPYAIFDTFINAGVYKRLLKMGVEIITFEKIPQRQMRRMSAEMPQNFFWYYSNQVCWAGMFLLNNRDKIDGIIHITAFGCGPDAMVDKLLELEAKTAGVPYINLSIDEHTGEGGVQTRLEAFVDMLWARKEKSRVVNS